MNYYKRHIGDYAAKAGHLSALEHGVYTLLIDAYYNREEGPTKAEAIRIARARSAAEIEAVEIVLGEFFTEADGRYTQGRIEEELGAFRIKQEANRLLGARGGVANAKRIATETLSEREAKQVARRVANDKPSHKPLASSHEEADQKRPPAAAFDFKADLFNRWKSMPASGGGAFLSKLFKDYKPEQTVIEAIERTMDDTRADPKSFVLGILKAAPPDQFDEKAQADKALAIVRAQNFDGCL